MRFVAEVHNTRAEWQGHLDALLSAMGRDGMLVLLAGGRGTGKTQAAAECIKRVCRDYSAGEASRRVVRFDKDFDIDLYEPPNDTPALYRTAMELFADLRAAYGKDSNTSEARAMRPFLDARLLVIDEAQERGETDFEDRMLTHLIDRRYANMRDTVLISNLKPDELSKRLNPSIIDRARQCGGVLVFGGTSFRQGAPA